MKRILTIAFWIAAIMTVAVMMVSLGYSLPEALFIGTLFMPGALAVEFFFQKAASSDRRTEMKNRFFIMTGVVIAEIVLLVIAHYEITIIRLGGTNNFEMDNWNQCPTILTNPVFIAVILAALSFANYYFGQWLTSLFPSENKSVTFLSDRKAVHLPIGEILYVESNDAVTTVVATGDRKFRNRTPISQWGAILGPEFLRIHRSYLVNTKAIEESDSEYVMIQRNRLPVSRKYRESVRDALQNLGY